MGNKKGYTSILFSAFDFSQIRGVINADQIAIKLDSDKVRLCLFPYQNPILDILGSNYLGDTTCSSLNSVFKMITRI